MFIICSLVLTMGNATVTKDVVGILKDSSELRYEVDFSTDIRRFVHRDASLPWAHMLVRKSQCVRY